MISTVYCENQNNNCDGEKEDDEKDSNGDKKDDDIKAKWRDVPVAIYDSM